MRRHGLALLAAAQLSWARSRSFTIHEDLLSFPQFEVVFSQNYISERDANALLERNNKHPTYSADFSQATIGQYHSADGRDEPAEGDGQDGPSYTYELMNMAPNKYICAIPNIDAPTAENSTANDLAKVEEAQELVRAKENGWQLLEKLEDSCLYYMSGWWSYSFCKNREIVQFHALPSMQNGQPPKRDPHTAEYVLGRVPAIPASAARQAAKQNDDKTPAPVELQVKGDQRYLIQRLEGGTICDLTERERTIEVQYHCAPGLKHDRIGWIKEITICAYVMVVNTPRLCDDVAFLPPEETKADPISCQLIVDDDTTPPLLDQHTPSEQQPIVNQEQQTEDGAVSGDAASVPENVNVGGVVVGARHVLSLADVPGEPLKLKPPTSYYPTTQEQGKLIEIVAEGASKEEGGEVRMLTHEEIKSYKLQVKDVEEMVSQIKKLSGGQSWKLELVEFKNGARELRGYIDSGDKKGQGSTNGQDTQEGKGKEEKTEEKQDDGGSEEKFFKKNQQ